MPQAYPSLNGVAPSWADVGINFNVYDGPIVSTADIAGISCSDTVEFGILRGTAGGRKQARTRGQEDNDASISFYRAGLQAFNRALVARAPTLAGGQKAIGLVGFDIIIQHTPIGDTAIYTIKIAGCRMAGRDFQFAEGSDADKVEIALNVMKIIEIIDGQEVVLI